MRRRVFLKNMVVGLAAIVFVPSLTPESEAVSRGSFPDADPVFLFHSNEKTHCIYCGADTDGWMTTACRDRSDGAHLPIAFTASAYWKIPSFRRVDYMDGLFPRGTRLWRFDTQHVPSGYVQVVL